MGERDEEAVRRFVEHFAMTMDDFGFPRMNGRVLGALTVSEDGAMTAREIGEWLGVSPAAISGAVRYLVHIGMVSREPVPGSRSVRYRMVSNTWYMENIAKGGVYKIVADLVAQGAETVGQGTPAGDRLREMADFFLFLQEELAVLVEKWHASGRWRGNGGRVPDAAASVQRADLAGLNGAPESA